MEQDGKTKAELDREAAKREDAKQSIRRLLELTGDTRTDEERQEALRNMSTYSPEEAAFEIAAIKRGRNTWYGGHYAMEDGAGQVRMCSEEEMIEMIRRNTRECSTPAGKAARAKRFLVRAKRLLRSVRFRDIIWLLFVLLLLACKKLLDFLSYLNRLHRRHKGERCGR